MRPRPGCGEPRPGRQVSSEQSILGGHSPNQTFCHEYEHRIATQLDLFGSTSRLLNIY